MTQSATSRPTVILSRQAKIKGIDLSKEFFIFCTNFKNRKSTYGFREEHIFRICHLFSHKSRQHHINNPLMAQPTQENSTPTANESSQNPEKNQKTTLIIGTRPPIFGTARSFSLIGTLVSSPHQTLILAHGDDSCPPGTKWINTMSKQNYTKKNLIRQTFHQKV